VGATSGIGEYTAKAFVKNALSPRVYIVGRNQAAAERIITECKELNKDGKVEFLKADVTELGEVDRVCEEIKKKEKHVNLIVQTQGNLTLRGRDGTMHPVSLHNVANFVPPIRIPRRSRPQIYLELLLPNAMYPESPPSPPSCHGRSTTLLTNIERFGSWS